MKKVLCFMAILFLSLGVYAGEFSYIRSTARPLIVLNKKTGDAMSFGSGVVIAPGKILSVAHVIPDLENLEDAEKNKKSPKIKKELPEIAIYVRGDNKDHLARIIKIDRRNDLVLLSVDVDCPCAELHVGSLEPDMQLYSVGYPLYALYGVQYVTTGIIQGFARKEIATTLEAISGSSGGPVFIKDNGNYRLMGLIQAIGKRDNQLYTWMTFIITPQLITEFLSDAPPTIEVIDRIVPK